MSQDKVRAPGAVKGMNDVRPAASEAFLDAGLWRHIFDTARTVATHYGYAQVWLPVVEETALFTRGLGEQTDVVAKEMYSMVDRGGRALSLRPEGTAGAARAYIEHHLGRNEPQQRWFYAGPMFRAERPQKGRYRQFYQVGAECFGAAGPGADVELLQMLLHLCRALGLPPVQVRLNTLGDAESRITYLAQLGAFVAQHEGALCADCKVRAARNPLRLLDCKNPGCKALVQDAPDILAALSAPSRRWFDAYIQLLEDVAIPYTRDRLLVRGLDYYTEAIFEFTAANSALGAQDALLGGGRYDGLVQSLGGPATPAVGFAAGVERLALLLAAHRARDPGVQLFFAVQAPTVAAATLRFAEALRDRGVGVEVGSDEGRLKAALKRADRSGAQILSVVGDNEVAQQVLRLKRLQDGHTVEVAFTVEAVTAALADGFGQTATPA